MQKLCAASRLPSSRIFRAVRLAKPGPGRAPLQTGAAPEGGTRQPPAVSGTKEIMPRHKTAAPSDALRDDLAPVPRGSGATKVYDSLKDDILSLRLPPGAALDETSLSQRFGLSRTPVREALQKLVAEGMATTLPNRTTIVAMVDVASLPHYLDAQCLMNRITARTAAINRSEADLAALRLSQDAFRRAVAAADAVAMIATNRDFHLAIASAAGNLYYHDLLARLLNDGIRLQRLYYRSFHDRLPPEYVQEHEDLLAAIADRDPERADAVALAHARQITEQTRRYIALAEAGGISL
jgi:DNA-binding GntR family transcriptional regulator